MQGKHEQKSFIATFYMINFAEIHLRFFNLERGVYLNVIGQMHVLFLLRVTIKP